MEPDRAWEPKFPGREAKEGDGGPQSRPLTVCFFAHSAHLAGAERTLLELVTQLREDYRVRCGVVVPGEGPLIAKLEAVGAEVIRTEYRWWCDTEIVPKAEARTRVDESVVRLHKQILPEVARLDPDVICTQTIVIPYGALAAAEMGRPHIWSIREQGEAVGLRFFRPFGEVAEFIREHSDFLFGANRGLCDSLIPGLRPEVHDVLYPTVRVPSDLGSLDCGLEFDSGIDFRVAEFATMSPGKRLDVAIHAIADLTERGRSVGLVIAGSQAPHHAEYLNRIIDLSDLRGRVLLRDFRQDVFPMMAAVDAVVISAPVHSFGRTAAESMFLAKPVIYPLGTGFDDYLRDGDTGLGYSAGDALSMADKIDLLIQNRRLREDLGLKARTAARSLFTRDGFGGKFYRRAVSLRDGVVDEAQFVTGRKR